MDQSISSKSNNSQESAKDLLNDWLEEQDISITQFAEDMGYTYSYAWNLLRGNRPIVVETLGRLVKAYGSELSGIVCDALMENELPELN